MKKEISDREYLQKINRKLNIVIALIVIPMIIFVVAMFLLFTFLSNITGQTLTSLGTQTVGPGGCTDSNSCKAYCTNNAQECATWCKENPIACLGLLQS